MAERYRTLDALRGIAVMGILLMNVVAFALPEAAYSNPAAAGTRSPVDLWSWAVAFVLVDGKMRALFSFLFGASMLLVIERADAEGRKGGGVHLRRMAVLFVIGIAHFVLLWWGDILHHYAIVGTVALLFVRLPTPTIVRLAIGAFVVTTLIYAVAALGLFSLRDLAGRPGADPEMVRNWTGFVEVYGAPTADALAKEIARSRGGYLAQVTHRAIEQLPQASSLLLFVGFETLGLMLLGMWGLRSGFLTGQWDRARYGRWALACYAIGLPPLVLLAWAAWSSNFDAATMFATSLAASAPFRPIVMLGHAAFALWLLDGRDGPLVDRIAATGRAAFSNYLATSVLMTTLFYGYGLGLFASLSRTQCYAIVPVVWLLMLAWSKPWLDRFRFGPAEWVWRSLARWRTQPMRR